MCVCVCVVVLSAKNLEETKKTVLLPKSYFCLFFSLCPKVNETTRLRPPNIGRKSVEIGMFFPFLYITTSYVDGMNGWLRAWHGKAWLA